MGDLTFHWADYIVFAASLMISAGVGIYFGISGKRQNSTEEFLMAGRSMSPIPVSVSLFVSWMSAISFLADPVEAYTYGVVYWILGIGYALGLPLVAHVFAPFFHKMAIVSAFEFLETKFSKGLRLFAVITGIMTTTLWLGVALYAPALALSQASGMPVTVAVISIGAVCVFYTTLGGMKAVLWTDTIQMVIMVAGQLAIVIQGCIKVGGVGKLFELASLNGRTMIDNFDPSPFRRATFWTFLIGGMFRVFIPYVSTQMQIQRYCTVKTPRDAILSVYLNFPMFIFMSTIFTAIGLVMAALYAQCDPLLDGRITTRDQMVPLLVLELLGFLPGIPGLFMACIFCASLSSLSSGINSMSANTLKDFIEPAYLAFSKKTLSDRVGTIIAKLLVAVYGVILVGMAFAMMATQSSIFALTSKAVGMVGSPLAGVFFIGILFPSMKSRAVIPAFTIALTLCLWIGIGAFLSPQGIPPETLPMTTALCYVNNTIDGSTELPDFTTSGLGVSTASIEILPADSIYNLNPLYYGPMGCTVTVVLASIFHWLFIGLERIFCRRKYSAVNKNDDKVVGIPMNDDYKWRSENKMEK